MELRTILVIALASSVCADTGSRDAWRIRAGIERSSQSSRVLHGK